VEEYYSLGVLSAKPGREGELRAAWQTLCDELLRLPGPPAGPVTLLQDLSDSTLHYSFAAWQTIEDLDGMRAAQATAEFFRVASEVCTEVVPGRFRVVGRSTPN
jgi:hypothetical protein